MNNMHNSCDQRVILGSPYGGRIDIFMLITLNHNVLFHTRSSCGVLRKRRSDGKLAVKRARNKVCRAGVGDMPKDDHHS
jgi:hypothetical protein